MQNLLDEKQQAVIPIAAFAACGEMSRLDAALQHGLDVGLTVNEINEILIQLYAYAGFPRSLNALTALMTLVQKHQQQGINLMSGPEASPISAHISSLEVGTQNQTKLVGQPVSGPLFTFAPAIDTFLKAHLFGDIFQRDVLSWQTRELATLSMLAALTGVNSQLKSHYAMSLNTGLTAEQLRSFVTHLALTCSQEMASNAHAVLDEALA